jgi:phosphoribosylaminoimidazolecarboxamide formyltransferase/IMP cyclohydrolase
MCAARSIVSIGSSSFTRQPDRIFTLEDRKAWIAQNTKVALGSDAVYFPLRATISSVLTRAEVEYIAQAGGSIRDRSRDQTPVINTARNGFTGVRLSSHH